MAPVEALMDRPVGRPEAVQVKVWPDWVSVAELEAEAAEPEALDLAEMPVTLTVLVMVQAKAVEAVWPPKSVALSTTDDAPGVVGVPVIAPVEELIAKPVGRPVADQVMVAVDDVSVAVAVIGEIAVPEMFDLAVVPGLVTAMVLVTFQVNVAEPE